MTNLRDVFTVAFREARRARSDNGALFGEWRDPLVVALDATAAWMEMPGRFQAAIAAANAAGLSRGSRLRRDMPCSLRPATHSALLCHRIRPGGCGMRATCELPF